MKTKFLDEYSCRNSQVDNKTPPFNSMDQVDNKTPQLNSMDKIDNKTPQFNSVDDETNDQLNSEPSQLPSSDFGVFPASLVEFVNNRLQLNRLLGLSNIHVL